MRSTDDRKPADLLWLTAALPFLLLVGFTVHGSVEVRSAPREGTVVLVDGQPAHLVTMGVHRSGPLLIGPHQVTIREAGMPEHQTSAFAWLSQRVVVQGALRATTVGATSSSGGDTGLRSTLGGMTPTIVGVWSGTFYGESIHCTIKRSEGSSADASKAEFSGVVRSDRTGAILFGLSGLSVSADSRTIPFTSSGDYAGEGSLELSADENVVTGSLVGETGHPIGDFLLKREGY